MGMSTAEQEAGHVSKPLLLFAHGAGASSSSAWMKQWTTRLQTVGDVVCFDYPYMQRGKRSPDPLPKLLTAHREALQQARATHTGPVFLIGKSMGSRVGCHLALEEAVSGLICMGYPLKGPSGKLRDEVLLKLRTPILFVQGTRDALCPLQLLTETREKMKAPSELHVVESGDHSLQATRTHLKQHAVTQEQLDEQVLQRIARFVASAA